MPHNAPFCVLLAQYCFLFRQDMSCLMTPTGRLELFSLIKKEEEEELSDDTFGE